MQEFLKDYEDFVLSLASPKSMSSEENKYLTGGIGIITEGGELLDNVKKFVFHDKNFNREAALSELGDVCWYVAFMARAMGSSVEEVMNLNRDKLVARYPEGKFNPKFAHAQGESH